MSRIGKQPVVVPAGVDVSITNGSITVKGKDDELHLTYHPNMSVEFDKETRKLHVIRPDDSRENRALHGLTRSLINNMVIGVVTPFRKGLEIQGVGYNAQHDGNTIRLTVGFANTVVLDIPKGVNCEVNKPGTLIILTSADKQAVGQFAANIRRVRPPEPYKGKGIRYQGEFVRRKAGKAFGAK